MKSLKFLFVAVLAAFTFVSCDQKPEQNLEHKGPIVLNWGKASDVNGKTFEIGMDNWSADTYELIVHVELTNTLSDSKTFTIKEVRGYDLTTAFASLCTSQCMPGNSQEEQNWEIGTVDAGDMMQVDLHLAPMVETATTFPVEFTFSDGTDNVTFTVKYNYTPVE